MCSVLRVCLLIAVGVFVALTNFACLNETAKGQDQSQAHSATPLVTSSESRADVFKENLILIGGKDRIAYLLKKSSLTPDERFELGECAALVAVRVGGYVTYDNSGNVENVVGHEDYFGKIRAKLASESFQDDAAPTDTPLERDWSTVSPAQQLEVLQWAFRKTRGQPGETTYEVSGEVLNHSTQYFGSAYFSVALKDKSGMIVATSHVSAGNIPAGGTAIITGYIIDQTNTPHPTGTISVSTAG